LRVVATANCQNTILKKFQYISQFSSPPSWPNISETDDNKLRALDKETGKLLWETTLPALANATAFTYQVKGKQYVAISVGGTTDSPSGYVMAFALPD
jgi:glucose dehydrogenase